MSISIGEKIIEERKREKLSQEKLAGMLEITRQTLSNWESDITSPDLKQSKKLCEIFEISMDELIGNNVDNLLLKRTKKLENEYNSLNDLIKLIISIIILFAIVAIPLIIFLFFRMF